METTPGPDGDTKSYILSAASACQRIVFTVSGKSISRQSVMGLPPSIASIIANSSEFASISVA